MTIERPAYVGFVTSQPLTSNFKVKEFASKDGAAIVIIDMELATRLQTLRDNLSRPIIITSGYRSEAHNKKVGGAAKSYHMLGRAADITCKGIGVDDLANAAKSAGFRGVIIYRKQNFVHVDTRNSPYFAESK